MFLGVNVLNFYVTICDKTPEVVILDCYLLGARSNLRINLEYDSPLIIFVNCDWIFKKYYSASLDCLLEV